MILDFEWKTYSIVRIFTANSKKKDTGRKKNILYTYRENPNKWLHL